MMTAEARVALLGGSFNPPHLGHRRLCAAVLAAPGIAAVWLVPVARHPGGKPLAPFADRMAMCRMLAAPLGQRVEVCPLEAELEGRLGGPVKTHALVHALAVRHPDVRFTLVMGEDVARHAPRWPGWADIERLAPPLVLPRFESEAGGEWSSTEARRRLATGAATAGLLPAEIAAYLARRRLYGEPPAPGA